MKKILIQYSTILLVAFLLEWWVFTLSPFNIPEYIPNTTFKIDGLALILTLILVIELLCKSLLRVNSLLTVLKLTLLGAFVCFNAEFVFQLVRQCANSGSTIGERVISFFRGVLIDTAAASILCFLIAFQIKTKKTALMMLFVAIIFVLLYYLRHLFQ